MAILLYQIGIFLAIQIAAIFGKNSRNTAVVLISAFTILQVFMSWLLLLQFITIFISFNISNNLFFSKTDKEIKFKKEEELVNYITKNGGRALMTKSDFEELKRKEREQNEIYYQKNKEKFDEFNKKTDEEKLAAYRKMLDEISGE